MRKRIVSLLLSLALCLTLLPMAALAEEAQPEELLPGEQLEQVQPVSEEPEENEEQSQQDEDVIAVQAMINALPDASALDEMDAEAQESACLAASEACEVYDALTKEQQSALTGTENMIAILEWATRQVTPLDDTTTGTEHQSHPICGAACSDGTHKDTLTWTGVDSLDKITGVGNYYLTKDVTLTSTWTPADGVKLCLNGHTITTTANVDAIEVDQNVTFTLTNCKGTGKITHQYTDQDNRVYTAKGCGAYVNGGTFHLYGGTFSRNIGHNIGRNTNGGGVYVDNNSTFTLSGSASITGNWTNGSGGGVYVYSGIFDMKSGTITGNKADTSGGGVHVGWSGTFHMSGGSITGNNVKKRTAAA